MPRFGAEEGTTHYAVLGPSGDWYQPSKPRDYEHRELAPQCDPARACLLAFGGLAVIVLALHIYIMMRCGALCGGVTGCPECPCHSGAGEAGSVAGTASTSAVPSARPSREAACAEGLERAGGVGELTPEVLVAQAPAAGSSEVTAVITQDDVPEVRHGWWRATAGSSSSLD